MSSCKSTYLNCITTNSSIDYLMTRPCHGEDDALLPAINKAETTCNRMIWMKIRSFKRI